MALPIYREPGWCEFVKYARDCDMKLSDRTDEIDLMRTLCGHITYKSVHGSFASNKIGRIIQQDGLTKHISRKYSRPTFTMNTLSQVYYDPRLKKYYKTIEGFVNNHAGKIIWENIARRYFIASKQSLGIKNVWLISQTPSDILELLHIPRYKNGNGIDNGIDLIIAYSDGKYGFVQCKYKHHIESTLKFDDDKIPKYYAALTDIHARLVLDGKSDIQGRNWICTNLSRDRLNKNKHFWGPIERGEVELITMENFSAKMLSAILNDKITSYYLNELKQPLRWQYEALLRMFNNGVGIIAQIVMPPAAGKTLLTYFFVAFYNMRSFVVFEPYNELLEQNMHSVLHELCGYYDKNKRKSNGIKGIRVLVISSRKMQFSYPNYPIHIKNSFKNDQIIIDWITDAKENPTEYVYCIFSTYNQQAKIVRACVHGDYMPDVVVCDEVHDAQKGLVRRKKSQIKYDNIDDKHGIEHCAVLHADFKPKYKFFTTATPVMSNDDTLTSMDDKTLFGEIIYTMTIGDAIYREALLCPYRITSLCAEEVEFQITKRLGYEPREQRLYIYMQILLRLIANGHVKKVIVYASEKKDIDFMIEKIINKYKGEYNLMDLFTTSIISETKEFDRKQARTGMNNCKHGILFNIRICIAGIDIPCIDGIFYACPLNQTCDIIQSSGRGLRMDPDNPDKITDMIIPYIIPSNASTSHLSLLQTITSGENDKFQKMCTVIASLTTTEKGDMCVSIM